MGFRLVRGVGEREEPAGRHDGEAVESKVRRGEALVDKLVGGGGRGCMTRLEEQDDQGYKQRKHNFTWSLALLT